MAGQFGISHVVYVGFFQLKGILHFARSIRDYNQDTSNSRYIINWCISELRSCSCISSVCGRGLMPLIAYYRRCYGNETLK